MFESHVEFAKRIKSASPGDVVIVGSEAMRNLGQRAARRLGRGDLVFRVEPRELGPMEPVKRAQMQRSADT